MTISKRGKKEWITQAELARRMGVTRQRILILTRNGRLSRNEKKKYEFHACKRIMEDGRAEYEMLDPEFDSFNKARTANEELKVQLNRLELQRQTGEVLPASEVVSFCQKTIAISRQRLLGISNKIAPELVGAKSIKKIKSVIDKEVHEVLTELSKLENVTTSVNQQHS